MVKKEVYNIMSFNKKRVPDLNILKIKHIECGDDYLNQFKSCDALIGSHDSIEYLNDFFNIRKDIDRNHIQEVLEMLTMANEILFKKASSKYQQDFKDLQKVINSITNK